MVTTTNPAAAKTATRVRKAGLFAFVFVMYSYTTAGPFGLEDQVTTSGPGLTLLYHLILPFFWCIPISLVAAELTTAIPVEGHEAVWRCSTLPLVGIVFDPETRTLHWCDITSFLEALPKPPGKASRSLEW